MPIIIKKLPLVLQICCKWLPLVTTVVAIAYLTLCILVSRQQTRLIFFPSTVIEFTPEYFSIPYEDVWLPVTAESGEVERLHAWWMPSKKPNAKVLLYLHGNGKNISANVSHAHRFYQLGFSVLLIDYRGYGRSEGSFPNEMNVYQDAETAWNYLVQQRQIPPKQIFLYGHSLGGAVAIDLALKQPKAAGLIVEGTFTSVRDVIDYRNMFRLFPVNLLLTQRFESIEKIPQLKMPILFIHGTADSTIPAFMSQKLYAVAPEPKKLILVQGADHNDVGKVAGMQYLQWVEAFVQKSMVNSQ
ncbi:alpha/beta hydrolase [Anabaena sp. UHCC 0399]|uniref:alpha/beta hydrolase n=1 Tax=Anabaena sp. UHCC 0399 TaxID=3110238 RepID=UPI002B21FE6C|nr:alpha/beta hydrolase [Anabaena sp. UHCC 0399]MEA5565317.1 alpha/beta hydrolase [Anabaena sp. UHCC 0399]